MGGNTSRETDPAKREQWERSKREQWERQREEWERLLTEIRTNIFPDTKLDLYVRD